MRGVQFPQLPAVGKDGGIDLAANLARACEFLARKVVGGPSIPAGAPLIACFGSQVPNLPFLHGRAFHGRNEKSN